MFALRLWRLLSWPWTSKLLRVQVTVKFKAMGELQENGKREVFFETFGVPRVLEVPDRSSDAAAARTVREKADASDSGSVGAPMAGDILEVRRTCGHRECAHDACRHGGGQRTACKAADLMSTAARATHLMLKALVSMWAVAIAAHADL